MPGMSPGNAGKEWGMRVVRDLLRERLATLISVVAPLGVAGAGLAGGWRL